MIIVIACLAHWARFAAGVCALSCLYIWFFAEVGVIPCTEPLPAFVHISMMVAAFGALLATWMLVDMCTRKGLAFNAAGPQRAKVRAFIALLVGTLVFCVMFAGLLRSFIDRAC